MSWIIQMLDLAFQVFCPWFLLAVGLTLFYITSSVDTVIDKEYERINHTTPPDLNYKWH